MNELRLIGGVAIRQDGGGRYCLGDLHKASGGAKSKQPSTWRVTQGAQDLLAELWAETPGWTGGGAVEGSPGILGGPLVVINDDYHNETYVCEELVIAYAAWISPEFHLKVTCFAIVTPTGGGGPVGLHTTHGRR